MIRERFSFFIPVFDRVSESIGESCICPDCGCSQVAIGLHYNDTGIFFEFLRTVKLFECTYCGLRWR